MAAETKRRRKRVREAVKQKENDNETEKRAVKSTGNSSLVGVLNFLRRNLEKFLCAS